MLLVRLKIVGIVIVVLALFVYYLVLPAVDSLAANGTAVVIEPNE